MPQIHLFDVPQALLFERRTDPGAQHRRIERLRQVVFRPEFDALNNPLDLIERRDHDHRNILQFGVRLHSDQHFIAVQARHQHIQQHQIRIRPAGQFQRLQAVAAGRDAVAQPLQSSAEQFAVRLVVVGQQQVAGAGNRRCRLDQRYAEPMLGTFRGRSRRAGFGFVDGNFGRLSEMFFHQGQPGVSRGDDLGEVRLQFRLPQIFALFCQQFAVADDVVYRRAQFVAQRMEIGFGVGGAVLAEVSIDQCQQDVAAAVDLLQVGDETRRQCAGRFFAQNFRVADDVVDGGSEPMADLGQARFDRAAVKWRQHLGHHPAQPGSLDETRVACSYTMARSEAPPQSVRRQRPAARYSALGHPDARVDRASRNRHSHSDAVLSIGWPGTQQVRRRSRASTRPVGAVHCRYPKRGTL